MQRGMEKHKPENIIAWKKGNYKFLAKNIMNKKKPKLPPTSFAVILMC